MEALFPFTKFLPPQLDARVVAGRAIERLDAAVATHQLTVICAPAGSGKTTALAAWTQQTEQLVAWVRLSPSDATAQVASAALLAGIRRVSGGFGDRLGTVLAGSETAGSVVHLVTSLVNDLEDHPELCLVLDDFHEVTAPVAIEVFDTLLDQLPAQIRVVVASRREPPVSLARRRVRGELAELGLADLRLDAEAIAAVLARDGPVDVHQVDAVARASRGWAAAVRLATARFSRGETTDPLGGAQPELWRFLAEEVVDEQPVDLRTFLLDTAILDELTPPVCAAVAGRRDAALILDELERRNLFVARFASDAGPAWRYHDLFVAFLQDQLRTERSEDEIASLHRRAAAVLPTVQAVGHLLAAGDHEQVAATAIEMTFASLDATVITVVEPWVRALPSEVIDRHHRLALLLALRDEVAGRPGPILARLRPIYGRLRDEGDELAAAEVGLELAAAHLIRGELDETGALLDQVLTQPLEGWWRMAALGTRMWWSRYRGDWAVAGKALQEAFGQALATDDAAVHRVLAQALSFVLLFTDLGPAWVAIQTRRLAERLTGPGSTASIAGLRPVVGGRALLELDLGTAADEVRRCLADSTELGRLAWTHQDAEALLLVLALASRDHATVRTVTAHAFARMEGSPIDEGMRHHYVYAAARTATLRRDTQMMDATVRSLHGVAPELEIVRAVVDAMQGGGPDLLDALAEAEQSQRELRCWLGVGLPGLERAAILLGRGDRLAALEAAAPTLETAATLGAGILLPEVPVHRGLLEHCSAAGLHAEMIAAVLDAIDRPAGTAAVVVPGTGEALSPREVEVLSHVADGRSNREIAQTLFISEVTVKSHLTRILRKLDASSRTHAVARARELHLL